MFRGAGSAARAIALAGVVPAIGVSCAAPIGTKAVNPVCLINCGVTLNDSRQLVPPHDLATGGSSVELSVSAGGREPAK